MGIPISCKSHVLALVFLALAPMGARGQSINVSTYGAVANDGIDHTAAIQAALNAATKLGNTTVLFAPGTYEISAPAGSNECLTLYKANSVTLEGNGAFFRIHSWVIGIEIVQCQNTVVRDIQFDWNPLPFVQAKILSHNLTGATLQVLSPSVMPSGPVNVQGAYEYDNINQRPSSNSANDFYPVATATLTPTSSSQAYLNLDLSKLPNGAFVVVRFKMYGGAAVGAVQSDGLTYAGLWIFSCPGMGLVFSDSSDVSVSNCEITIPNGSARWISTCADGINFSMCRGNITIEDCTLSRMGDDGISFHSLNLVSTGRVGTSGNSIYVQHGGAPHTALPPFRIGDVISFAPSADPFHPTNTATVTSCSISSGQSQTIAIGLSKSIPDTLILGTVIKNQSWLPRVLVSATSISLNRARGFWIQVPNAEIEACAVTEASGPAVDIRCDVNYWWEGDPAQSVVIDNCDFTHCNYGIGKNTADFNIYAIDKTGLVCATSIEQGIVITNNRFISDGLSLSLCSTDRVLINGNSFMSLGAPGGGSTLNTFNVGMSFAIASGLGVGWTDVLP